MILIDLFVFTRSDALPAHDEAVKKIRVKNPIMQEFHGSHGTYTQANIEKQRSYNLPQWKALCEDGSHQPTKSIEEIKCQNKIFQTRHAFPEYQATNSNLSLSYFALTFGEVMDKGGDVRLSSPAAAESQGRLASRACYPRLQMPGLSKWRKL